MVGSCTVGQKLCTVGKRERGNIAKALKAREVGEEGKKRVMYRECEPAASTSTNTIQNSTGTGTDMNASDLQGA